MISINGKQPKEIRLPHYIKGEGLVDFRTWEIREGVDAEVTDNGRTLIIKTFCANRWNIKQVDKLTNTAFCTKYNGWRVSIKGIDALAPTYFNHTTWAGPNYNAAGVSFSPFNGDLYTKQWPWDLGITGGALKYPNNGANYYGYAADGVRTIWTIDTSFPVNAYSNNYQGAIAIFDGNHDEGTFVTPDEPIVISQLVVGGIDVTKDRVKKVVYNNSTLFEEAEGLTIDQLKSYGICKEVFNETDEGENDVSKQELKIVLNPQELLTTEDYELYGTEPMILPKIDFTSVGEYMPSFNCKIANTDYWSDIAAQFANKKCRGPYKLLEGSNFKGAITLNVHNYDNQASNYFNPQDAFSGSDVDSITIITDCFGSSSHRLFRNTPKLNTIVCKTTSNTPLVFDGRDVSGMFENCGVSVINGIEITFAHTVKNLSSIFGEYDVNNVSWFLDGTHNLTVLNTGVHEMKLVDGVERCLRADNLTSCEPIANMRYVTQLGSLAFVCPNLTSFKIKELGNASDWYFSDKYDGTNDSHTFILPSLNQASVKYLVNNLANLVNPFNENVPVSSATLHLFSEWQTYITEDEITAANNKGWTILFDRSNGFPIGYVNITPEFNSESGCYYNAAVDSTILKTSNGSHMCTIITSAKAKNKTLKVQVAKFSSSSGWANGIIQFVDSSNKVISGIGTTDELSNTQYTTFDIVFPENAVKCYVNSAIHHPVRVFKKV